MKIYQRAGTPSASRVAIYLKLKGIEIDEIDIDIRGGENLTDAFKAISVTGLIPALELDDGTTISESVAICRYFEALYPDQKPNLFGISPIEQAKVEMWQRIVELNGLRNAFDAFRNVAQIYKDRENCIEEWGHEAKLRLTQFLPKLEKQLSMHPYVAGENLSIADITAFVLVNFLPYVDVSLDDNSYPSLLAWHQKLSQNPAFQRR